MGYEFKDLSVCGQTLRGGLPALTDGVETKRHAVTIVGGGPVGLAAGAGPGQPWRRLGRDRSRRLGVLWQPRHLHLAPQPGDHRAAGRAATGSWRPGLPWTGGRSFYRDTEVLHFTMPQDENQKLPPMVNLAQYHIEQFLLDAAEQRRRPDRHPLADPASPRSMHARTAPRSACPRPKGDYALRRRLAGRLRRRPQHGARGARPAAPGHELRRPLRDRRYRARERPADRAPGLVRPAVQPGLHRAGAQAAGRRLAHRLPVARRRGRGAGRASRKT